MRRYRYEFHIARGASLKDKLVYRVEFAKTLRPEAPSSRTDPLGGGNELLWQITGGTETMKVTRRGGRIHRVRPRVKAESPAAGSV